MKTMFRNPVPYDLVFIDSCAIDHIRASTELNTFFETMSMNVCRSDRLHQEISHPNTPESTQKPFKDILWREYDTPLSQNELNIKEGIRKIMQNKAIKKDHTADADHIFRAIRAYSHFITVENRILRKADKLSQYLASRRMLIAPEKFIFSPDEYLEINLKLNE